MIWREDCCETYLRHLQSQAFAKLGEGVCLKWMMVVLPPQLSRWLLFLQGSARLIGRRAWRTGGQIISGYSDGELEERGTYEDPQLPDTRQVFLSSSSCYTKEKLIVRITVNR